MQPIMSLTAPHETLNFEVLLRMRDADGRAVRTDHLIAAGEASGRMGVIDRWVLANTLAWLDKNQLRMQHTKFVCMNLSGASLNDETFLQDVYDTFSRQKDDLFVFLGKIRVEGRPLTEEERIDGYCAILTNEDWSGTWEDRPFEMATDGVWNTPSFSHQLCPANEY